MDNANVSIVKQLYDAFGRGDVPGILSHLGADVTWITEGPGAIPFAGTMHGPAEVGMFFSGLSVEQKQKLVPTTFVADGDHVAVFGRYEATVTRNGRSYSAGFAHHWTIRAGKVTYCRNYPDTARMAEAHGA